MRCHSHHLVPVPQSIRGDLMFCDKKLIVIRFTHAHAHTQTYTGVWLARISLYFVKNWQCGNLQPSVHEIQYLSSAETNYVGGRTIRFIRIQHTQ